MELRKIKIDNLMKSIHMSMPQGGMILEYEKYKMQTCAKSFYNLASVLMKDFGEHENIVDRNMYLYQQCLREQKNLMADNLHEVADKITQMAENNVKLLQFEEKKKKQIVHLLSMEGVAVKEIYLLEEGQGYLEIGIILKDKKRQNLTAVDIGDFLSVLLNRRLEPTKETSHFITDEFQNMFFKEQAKFHLLTGVAKATKENEAISGDNYSFLEIDNHHFTAMISDGMGSGEKACRDSEVVIDLTEKLLESGFSVKSVVHMVNDMLLVTPELQNMSTLDICNINLYTGICEFTKVGAASTYIKNGNHIEKISSSSLPFGMFHPISAEIVTKNLANGDYIILLSDGVIDEIEEEVGEDCLKEFLCTTSYQNPTEIANFIMKYIISMKKGRIRDDMTILVMGLWEK